MSSQKFDLSKLSNEELLLYKQLLQKTAIDKQWDMLRNPDKHQVNPNYKFVFDAFHEQKYDVEGNLVGGRRGVVLEGSSRSGKTFSVILFLIKLCKDSDKPLTINVVRETYNGHKITLYKDFDAIYTMLGIEDNPFRVLKDIAQVTINKSKIYFLGADNAASAMGNKSDIVYINEAIDVTFEFYKEMVRRNKFFILDYNPRFTEHWIYSSVIPRSDVGFLRTTFLDNPHVDIQSKNEILRLEPFEPNSYEIVGQKELWYNGAPISDENQPPPHPINVKEGTANVMEWMIMGLGLRGAMRGVIFTNVREIDKDEVPYDLGYSYGLDFGFTIDPTVLTRNWESDTDIYIEYLSYHPIDNPDDLANFLEQSGVEKHLPITCDSSDRYTSGNNGTVEMVLALQDYGFEAYKVSKTKGVMYWLNLMRKKRINLIKNKYIEQARTEFENYKIKEIDGKAINQPIDKFNHGIDSARYRFMAFNDTVEVETEWY